MSALFSVAGDAFLDYKLIPINSRYRFSERALVDTKFNITYRQEKYVIYDVNENRVYVKGTNINAKENRHFPNALKNTARIISYLKCYILHLI